MFGETVWVPQVEGGKIHKNYVGIPKNDYLNQCKISLEKFLGENQNGDVEVSGRQIKNVKKVDVSIENDEIIIKTQLINDDVSTKKLKPTRFGLDDVEGRQRFWVFGGVNNDYNYISHKWQ